MDGGYLPDGWRGIVNLGPYTTNSYVVGDCRELLRALPDESINCVVTSPPYWGLRDYGEAGQLGLESTPEEYVANMVEVFREVKRALRDDGTLWLNLGDSYNAAGRNGHGTQQGFKQGTNRASASGDDHNRPTAPGLKPKDLVGIPWRVAFALQADGWYLRSEIIWHKPNPMPESVTDRPTKSHEQLFLLSKSERYHYDAEAIVEDAISSTPAGNGFVDRQRSKKGAGGIQSGGTGSEQPWDGVGGKRNKRSVWSIAGEPTKDAHFATYPRKLVEPCILAGCPAGGIVLDPFAGSGTTARVAEDLGRRWLCFDLSEKYKAIAARKTAQTGLLVRCLP